jgi:predicted helicase
MTTIHDVLGQFREASFDERDKGDLFEKLTKRFFEIDPLYSTLFTQVWFYKDWASERGFEGKDTGIDLVAKLTESDGYVAIQCKFYAEDAYLDLKMLGTFFATSGKDPFTQRFIVSTTNNWSKTAEDAIQNQTLPVTRINIQDLENSAVDWSTFSLKDPTSIALKSKKIPFDHQREAIDKAKEHFAAHDRGKLIMACGTGKTYTSLNIVEEMTPKGGTVLFLVPSIALLSQTLKEWKQEASSNFRAYAVCSDTKVGRRTDDSDTSIPDLAYPATTKTAKLAAHFNYKTDAQFTVIFSTYQSIDVVAQAQANGVPEFDLIVCDEAHRTTGVTLSGSDESAFVRVHNNNFIKAKKRLYMTATPRIFAEASKAKAQDADAVLASMDDEALYGQEFHRLNFGTAVSQGLLTDYKVLVLAVSEEHVSTQLQRLLAHNGELELNDAIKIVGCYNGLRKRSDSEKEFVVDPHPMKTAVAFARSIKDSKRISEMFEVVTDALNKEAKEENPLKAEAEHVDGTFNVLARNEKLEWLKDSTTDNTVRILSNARCLSEGVDVPALDAVLFLNPRDSQVDVVQSVGRVMRKSPGKQYGYVILPITVPAGQSPEDALADHKTYKVVWQVLQALRSHDERFDALVNKIDLTGNPEDSPIQIVDVGIGRQGDDESTETQNQKAESAPPTLWSFDDWKDAIFAKIVQKVGQRTYWENWAQDVATIAKNHISRITHLVSGENEILRTEFASFLKGLQDNLNPSISQTDAIEMLAQHLITKPVFDALFEGYAFTELNPVSVSMQRMITALESASINKETESLEGFYESVRLRASGIKDGPAKQKIVKELYEKFFRLAFAGTSEKLGIVYTPNEIVDYIIHSVNEILKNEFGAGIGSPGVHVLDPFTGTGTFIVRLLQSGLISNEQLGFKFRNELHANEIVLLAYYVAAINIEETYHSITGEYEPFQGIVLTDTFQMTEGKNSLDSFGVFPDNNERVIKQNELDIRVVIGNPPYSVGQSNANDQNENLKYEDLDDNIARTYVSKSSTRTRTSMYDSYIRAFRWASDRIQDRGVIGFVTNGSWLESLSADGFRKSLGDEFSSIYIFNLRGNARTRGEVRKAEGGGVFGEGSRTPVSITILVKNPDSIELGKIYYRDIGDYLKKDQKLDIVREFGNVFGTPFEPLRPNEQGDWLNLRNNEFESLIPLVSGDKKGAETSAIFNTHSSGVMTTRDAWVYNFDREKLAHHMKSTIDFYNSQVDELAGVPNKKDRASADPTKISWSGPLFEKLERGKRTVFDENHIRTGTYRPFISQFHYFDKFFNHSLYQLPNYFPKDRENIAIMVSGKESGRGFSSIVVDNAPNYHALPQGRVFPLWTFAEGVSDDPGMLFREDANHSKQPAITNWALSLFRENYGQSLEREDIFYYTFGILNCEHYKAEFGNSLSKDLPRIPLLKDFWGFVSVGKELASLQLRFHELEEYPLTKVFADGESRSSFKVEKMRLSWNGNFGSIKYNSNLTLEGIPVEANGFKIAEKSSVEWMVERFQLKTDSDSGIMNDPNSISDDDEYLVREICKAVTFGIEGMRVLGGMPKYETL